MKGTLFSTSVAVMALSGQAQAQVAPPINESITRGAQIEDAIDRTAAKDPRIEIDDSALDDEAGIYILRKQDIFFVAGTAALGYASNPARTADDQGDSASYEVGVSAGVRTRLFEAVDFTAALNADRTEYFESFAPSNDVVSASATIGTPIAGTPLYVGLSGFAGWNFDEKFRDGVSFYGARMNLAGNFEIAPRIFLQPALSATRQWSEISENNAKSGTARLALTAIRPRLSATIAASVTRLWFDDFYEDVTFVERRDWQYEAEAGFSYRWTPALTVGANIRFARRDSTFYLSEYKGWEGGPFVSAIYRF